MAELNKKVLNPLLSASVTGGTVEDFSQHALLLPAENKPPPPVLNLSSQIKESANPQIQSSFLEAIPNTSQNQPNYFIPEPQNQQSDFLGSVGQSNQSNNFYENQHQPSQPTNLSSVFYSFSNILKNKVSNQNLNQTPDIIPPPAGIGNLINQESLNTNPVPLFRPENFDSAQSKPPQIPQGPVNSFRRIGPKRPVYAQLPGLTSHSQNTPISNQQSNQGYSIFTPQSSFPQTELSSFASPVMTAVSANEIMQSTNFDISSNVSSGDNLPKNSTVPPQNAVNNLIYRPVYNHWFHKKEIENKVLWEPFTMVDSLALDEAFTSNDLDPDKFVATDGGRYDVNILRRERIPVYWTGSPNEVRRCSWFYKSSLDGRYVPYEENIATKLEEEFKLAFESKQWNRKVELPSGETVIFHDPEILVLYPPTQSPDTWGNTPNQTRPKVVKRGMGEFDIDEGEPAKADHLLFLVHGIGSGCDIKFRAVEEVVDDFRSISLQLVQAHYRSSCEKGIANRVEVLPISWHEQLHSDDTGIDLKLKSITLESIPRLRDFTNDTLLDILFYTSPVYCQTIISTVGNEMNRICDLFKKRNPSFNGGVSLGGHSLGSLILFDILCHQHPEPEIDLSTEEDDVFPLVNKSKPPPLKRRISRRISYMMGSVGTGQPQIHYPHLNFQPKAFFALGSPIGMFVTVRGLDNLGEQFALPTCPAFFNIFHPYDPVAYRIESLINPDLAKLKPVLIPHHKGRKRIHLELKETMARVGTDLKNRVFDSMRSTWNSVYQLAMFHRHDRPSLEEEVDKAIKEQLESTNEQPELSEEITQEPTDLPLGILNNNRRIDYVLQETPFEFFNDYIFALTSHVCYWDSQDTMLLILKEIYSSMNISTDDKIPQQTMTIERPPSSPKSKQKNPTQEQDVYLGMDPTVSLQQNVSFGPPPTSGFVRKT